MQRTARNLFSTILSIAMPTMLLAACGHPPVHSPNHSALTEIGESKIDIAYDLRHSHRRFTAEKKNSRVTGQTYLDHKIILEGAIEPTRYHDFLEKVSKYIEKARTSPSSESLPSCRSPFTMTLKLGSESRILKGCRSNDEGTLSRLIKEGEFLLYSKK